MGRAKTVAEQEAERMRIKRKVAEELAKYERIHLEVQAVVEFYQRLPRRG